MSLTKPVHVGLLVFVPLTGLHMQVHKLIGDLLQNVTSYTALYDYVSAKSHDYSNIFIEFAFETLPFCTPLKSKISDLDATRLQENTPKIQNVPGEHAPGPP